MSQKPILPNTILCAIVRDEMTNPAGGIESFLDAHLPHFEQAVIVDTGSTDGTLQYLQKRQEKERKLKLLAHSFTGFDTARNTYLEEVRRRFSGEVGVLSLDADELLTTEEAQNLSEIVIQGVDPEVLALKMQVLDVDSLGKVSPCRKTYRARMLFLNKITAVGNLPELVYHGKVGELPYARIEGVKGANLEFDTFVTKPAGINILQFLPPAEALVAKRKQRYQEGIYIPQPEKQGLPDWKRPNPFRAKYQ